MFGKNSISHEPHGYNVELNVCLFKDEGHFIAHCPALDISSYGDDEEEAKKMFNEAVTIFLEEVEQRGTLDSVLLDLGWSLQRKPEINYRPPHPDLIHNEQFQQFCGQSNHFNTKLTLPVE